MNRLLFLCTGNYYRSRFAEQYFNYYALERGLPWRADSKGLLRDLDQSGNLGPISSHTIDYLTELGLPVDDSRDPMRMELKHFQQYQRIVAASRDEHYPMMLEIFPDYAEQIHYFTVEDLHIYGPERALPGLVLALDTLLDELTAQP